MKARNDCEFACDCVKRANVVLHVRLCKEIFARKHTATHKPTSAQPLSAPHSDQRDTHTYIHTYTHALIACGALWPTAWGAIIACGAPWPTAWGAINRLWSPLAYGLGGNNSPNPVFPPPLLSKPAFLLALPARQQPFSKLSHSNYHLPNTSAIYLLRLSS